MSLQKGSTKNLYIDVSEDAFDLASLKEELSCIGFGDPNDVHVERVYDSLNSDALPAPPPLRRSTDFWKDLEEILNYGNRKEHEAARSILLWKEKEYHQFVRGCLYGALSEISMRQKGTSNFYVLSEKTIDECAEFICSKRNRRGGLDLRAMSETGSCETVSSSGTKRPDLVLVFDYPPLPLSIVVIELKYVPLSYLRFPKKESGGHYATAGYQLSRENRPEDLHHLYADKKYEEMVRLSFPEFGEIRDDGRETEEKTFNPLETPQISSVIHNGTRAGTEEPKQSLQLFVEDAIAQCEGYVAALHARLNSMVVAEESQPFPFKVQKCIIVGAWRSSKVFL